jgi:hypothetical protein
MVDTESAPVNILDAIGLTWRAEAVFTDRDHAVLDEHDDIH